MNEIADYEKVCEQAVRAAGALLLDQLGRVEFREKGPADLVTQADFASQEMVRGLLRDVLPDHGFLAEEDPPLVGPRSEYLWILDPLDGTTNFVHGFPFFAVSLALEHKGQPLVGAVYNPVSNECFTAAAGHGARLNGEPIRTSAVGSLDQAVASAGLPARIGRDSLDLAVFIEAAAHCQSIRRTGSASLNLAFVAAGRMDVFWSFATKVWDVAAGALLIREAGGVVTQPDGRPWTPAHGRVVAAASPALHEQFLALVGRSAV